jgi:hypothetical protein
VNDPMIDRLQETLRARADSLAIGPAAWSDGIEVGAPPARPRPMFWVFAAAAAVIVAAGGVTVAIDWQRQAPERLVPATPALPSIAAAPTTLAPSTSAPTDASSDAVGWYVPSWVPDGFEVASSSAMRMPLDAATGVASGAWIDRREGTIDRRMSWSSFIDPDPMSNTSPDAEVVRGLPAHVVEEPDGSMGVQWYEAGRTNLVSATMDRTTVLAIIEGATVDAATGFVVDPTVLPPGVELVEPVNAELAPELGLTTSLTFRRGHGPDAGVLTSAVSPNPTGVTLDALLVRGTVMRTTVDGVDREVATGERDGRPWAEVRWFADGFAFTVRADNVDRPTVEAFAAGLTAADEEAFLAFDRTITERGIATPIFEQVVFDDGLAVSLRATDATTFTSLDRFAPPGFLCLEAHTRRCVSADRGGSTGGVGGLEINVFALFEVDGRKTLIFWASGEPENLSVAAGSAVRTSAPRDDPIPFEQVAGTHGVFLRIDIGPGVEFVSVRTATGGPGTNVSMEIFDLPVRTTE